MSFAVEKSRTIISAMILGRKVTAQDVAWLRREVFAEGEVTRDTADELFAVARARMDNAPEWIELFVELMTDYVVWQSRPTGVVTDDEAQWLIARADECKSMEALAALVNVLAEAQRAPQWFVTAVRARAAQWPGVEAALRAPRRVMRRAGRKKRQPASGGCRPVPLSRPAEKLPFLAERASRSISETGALKKAADDYRALLHGAARARKPVAPGL